MRLQSPSRLLLVAALTLASRASSSGLLNYGDVQQVAPVLAGDPLLLAPRAAHATDHAEPQPRATVADSIVTTKDTDKKQCCDDRHERFNGTVILVFLFLFFTALSIFGLWTSLKRSARRAASAEPPPSLAPPPTARNLGSYRIQSHLTGTVGGNYARSVGSGTPSVRSWNADISRSRTRSGGSQRSWASNTNEAELSETPQSFRSMQMWIYMPPELKPVDIRQDPSFAAPRVPGKQLERGNVFLVTETVEGEDGVLFLHIADMGGWVFDRVPPSVAATSAALTAAGGILCKPVELLPLSVVPEEDKAGFKVAFKKIGPLVTAVTSQSALDAGLRDGDRIMRVDGDWVQDKLLGRAALARSVNKSRSTGTPMALEIFRDEASEEAESDEIPSAIHNGNEDGAQVEA